MNFLFDCFDICLLYLFCLLYRSLAASSSHDVFQHPVAIWKDFHRVGQRVPLIGNVSPHGRPGPEALMILEYLIPSGELT